MPTEASPFTCPRAAASGTRGGKDHTLGSCPPQSLARQSGPRAASKSWPAAPATPGAEHTSQRREREGRTRVTRALENGHRVSLLRHSPDSAGHPRRSRFSEDEERTCSPPSRAGTAQDSAGPVSGLADKGGRGAAWGEGEAGGRRHRAELCRGTRRARPSLLACHGSEDPGHRQGQAWGLNPGPRDQESGALPARASQVPLNDFLSILK